MNVMMLLMDVQRRCCICDTDVVGKTPDYARGEGLVDSDDSEDTDSEPGMSDPGFAQIPKCS